MQARLLVFDPDIEARRLLRGALSVPGLEPAPIVRATAKTAAEALRTLSFDAILLGMPTNLEDSIPLLAALQSLSHCPPVFFFHSVASPDDSWFTKDTEGIQRLRSALLSEIRAYKLQRAAASLQATLKQIEGSARSHLAVQITNILGDLDLPAMYVSIDPLEFWWEIRSSSFSPYVENEIVSITDALGGVAPDPAELSGPLKQLFAGEIDDYTSPSADFLQTIMPETTPETLQRLNQVIGISNIHVVAIRTDHRLNGFLLVGYSPTDLERIALLSLGEQFGRLLNEAEEYDLLSQQARSMRALQEVMLSLSATLDPSDLLDNVLDKLERVVPFDLAGIAINEDDGLKVHASRGDPSDLRDLQHAGEDTDERSQRILSLIEQESPVLLRGSDLESAFDGFVPDPQFASWISVPISWAGDQLGYLFLASKQAMGLIHLEISISFARQLAIALQNARLLQGSKARAEQLQLVNDIGRYSVSVLDPQQLVEEVASRVRQVFHYYAVRILLVEGDELVPYALSAVDTSLVIDPERTISLEEVQEVALALQRDQPVQLDIDSPRWREIMPPQLLGAQAVVFIPLSIVSEVIGIMEIYAQTPHALGREDVDVLQVLAAQIAISVVNARLFNEIRSHAVKLESRVEQRTQELQSQKERTEAILRSVADAILVLDMDGAVVMTNPPGQELLDADHGKDLHESVRQMFVAEGVVQSSIEIGEVTYQALASPVEFEGQMQGIVVVLRDITSLKELDQLKNQFVATVSHELRTPLTNIKLYLSLLHSADEEKRGRYHKVLIRETERLSDMIEDLLNLSRLEAQRVLDKEEVALAPLLQLVADNHEPACVSKGIKFSTDLSHRALVMADRAQIIQVFTNLLANAIAYTPVGGEIALRIVGTEVIESQRFVKIVLRDTGIGIRKEDLPHVFDRFYRGAGAQNYQAEGSGLGLAIVREILDNHDAKVAVDSQPGKGTKFTVWLPALGK